MLKVVSSIGSGSIGAVNYKGTWDASINSPTLTSSVGTQGDYYVVNIAGSTDLNGITDWQLGDWAIFNGSVWQKVDNTDAVSSVNGQVGTVVLTAANVNAVAQISSSTNNAVAVWDGTSGKLIKNSSVTLDTNGNFSNVNGIVFDITPGTLPTGEGSMYWNTSDRTLDLIMRGGNVVQKIGEELLYTVRNDTGNVIPIGTPVYASGVTVGSGRIEIDLAIADGSIDDLRFIGVTTENISTGINGYVVSFGYVRNFDTRGTPYGETWNVGDVLYVSPTTAGQLTNIRPTAPDLTIVVAIVINVNQTSGVIFVRPTAYPAIVDLTDVGITSPANNDVIVYNSSTNVWVNTQNLTLANISAANVTVTANLYANLATSNTAAMPDPSLPLNPEGYLNVIINGSAKKIPYYGV